MFESLIRLFLPFFLLFQQCSPPESPDFDKAKMDSLFTRIEAGRRGMGSVSIFRDGKEVYSHSFGFADVARQVPADHSTVYRVGSISKTFTAVIVLQLIEEGKLNLSSTLDEFFPQLPNAADITIEHLLRHRSGLYNLTDHPAYDTWRTAPQPREKALELIASGGSLFTPGERMQYSNSNYILLTYIAEDLEGKSFGELLQERIAGPLKLRNTYYGGSAQGPQDGVEALSYTAKAGGKGGEHWLPVVPTDMNVPQGAGGILSTPSELNVFFSALFTGELLDEASLKEMTRIVDRVGLGLFAIPFYERESFGHAGGIDGFASMAAYFPGDSLAVAYLSNGVVMPVNDIMIGILSIYFGRDYKLPVFSEAIEVGESDLALYPGIYSSPSFPLKITISLENGALKGQATGQPSFPLEAYDKHKFRFEQAGLRLEFIPSENRMILHQGGQEFVLSKE